MAESTSNTPDIPLTTGRKLPVSEREFVVLIAALMALNALAIDIMLPALDDMSVAFSMVNPNDQQIVIYAYVLGFGIPQLVWGPLSDSFGRKPILFFALAGYSLMGLACIFAPNFAILIVMRFLQGVFASACRVVAISMVRDIFVGRGMARIMSLVMTIFMIVPILAPSIGQVVLYVAPWQWIFAALTIYGALIFAWVWFRVPETLPDGDRPDLSLQESARAYGEVFSTRVTLGYMAASGVIFGALFAFIGSAEQIMTEVYDTGDAFVVWFALVAATLSVATYTNSRLVERFGMRRLSQAALIGFIGFALLLLVLLSVFGERFYIFFPLFAAMFACFGMIGSNFNAMAMEPLGKIAGTASAAYGFATTTFSSLLGWIIGSQYNGSSIPVVAGFAVLGILCFAVVFVVERGKLFQCR